MSKMDILRSSMTQWRLFGIACIFVGGLLLKAGAPLYAVAIGMTLAALTNWASRRSAART